ncbi:MAG TPA: bacterioferritin [Nevskiaceae bacterium]|nr:bacterioferritin [Nevskiaceae bacterium]
MKGDPKVLDCLNQGLRNELTSINQYFLHSRMLANQGFNHLAEHEYKESVDEMKHADRLIQRILLLEGLPNLQDLGKLYVGEDVPEMLQCDLRREREAHPDYTAAIGICEAAQDYVSRALLVDIQHDEEDHIDWLETQLELVAKVGAENYLQSQMGSADD